MLINFGIKGWAMPKKEFIAHLFQFMSKFHYGIAGADINYFYCDNGLGQIKIENEIFQYLLLMFKDT